MAKDLDDLLELERRYADSCHEIYQVRHAERTKEHYFRLDTGLAELRSARDEFLKRWSKP